MNKEHDPSALIVIIVASQNAFERALLNAGSEKNDLQLRADKFATLRAHLRSLSYQLEKAQQKEITE